MNRFVTAAFAAAALAALQTTSPVQAQEQPAPQAHIPPSWDTLAHCADMTDKDRELECYRAAMRDAGYRRNPKVAAAERRKTFGLNLSPFGPSGGKGTAKADGPALAQAGRDPAAPAAAAATPPVEDQSRITVTISDVAYTQPLNQLLIVTSDGAVWLQDDSIPLNFTPKRGQTVEIRKTMFGGYFCKFDRTNSMRCVRRN
jgi:hypothetical protein